MLMPGGQPGGRWAQLELTNALTGRSGDLMTNLETPGKTGRVGRYDDTPKFFSYPISQLVSGLPCQITSELKAMALELEMSHIVDLPSIPQYIVLL